jgi:hypothetical protein
MKKLPLLAVIITAVVFVQSCRKQDASQETALQRKNLVVDWLDKKIGKGEGKAAAIAKGIKENIQMELSWINDYKDGQQIIVVPINKNYQFVNNKNVNPNNYLVLFKTNDNKISEANVWQTLPGTVVTKNSFLNIYLQKNEDLKGTYVLLDTRDNFIRQVTYENNQLKEMMQRKIKPSETTVNSGTLVCTDYYVLRTYYANGEVIGQEVMYTFQVCNCAPTNVVQTTIQGTSECDPSGGGGVSIDASVGISELMNGSIFSYTTNIDVSILWNATQTLTSQFKCGDGQYWEVMGNATMAASKSGLNNNITVHSVTGTSTAWKQIPYHLQPFFDIQYQSFSSQLPAVITNNVSQNPKSTLIQKGEIHFKYTDGLNALVNALTIKEVTGILNVQYHNQ